MNTLRQSIAQYLALRRSLGYKLAEAGRTLSDFAAFMERHRATYLMAALALRWAQEPSQAQPSYWATRLSKVWNYDSDPLTNVVEVYIRRLRTKLN